MGIVPVMHEFEEVTSRLVEMALAEDVGAGDLTVAATVPEGTPATARIVQKQGGVLSGIHAVDEVFGQLGGVEVEWESEEGKWREGPVPVARLTGDARAILTGERTALNFLGHLSGVATLTARYVEAVRGTTARILDTRKTTPGMRLLEKAAVVAGGGVNHRIGLFDAVLIKENHIALAGGVPEAIAAAQRAVAERSESGGGGIEASRSRGDTAQAASGPGFTVEVECETLDQVREAITAGADRIMLDNMEPEVMREAVALRDREAGAPKPIEVADGLEGPWASPEAGIPQGLLLEASGGINLDTVRAVAECGVDLISVGALTHSAPTLDLSMLVEIER